MALRHENELLARLEKVCDKGFAEITFNELLIWYNQERVTSSVWADISERWYNLLESTKIIKATEKEASLFCAKSASGWTFIWGGGLEIRENSWWEDVRSKGKKNLNN